MQIICNIYSISSASKRCIWLLRSSDNESVHRAAGLIGSLGRTVAFRGTLHSLCQGSERRRRQLSGRRSCATSGQRGRRTDLRLFWRFSWLYPPDIQETAGGYMTSFAGERGTRIIQDLRLFPCCNEGVPQGGLWL